ncbi:hypothetical protein [Kitasatospora aureofaciens]
MPREAEPRDRVASIELLASPQVHSYLGRPRSRDELEGELPEVPERWPGRLPGDDRLRGRQARPSPGSGACDRPWRSPTGRVWAMVFRLIVLGE